MPIRRTLRTSIFVLAACLGTGSARAQSAQDKAAADVLFQQAKKLMQEGKVAEACPRFAESLRLDLGIGTMLWLADCYDRSGKTASAWAQFQEAAETAAKARDGRERVARERASKLEPKLVRLQVNVPPSTEVSGIRVQRDGSLLGKPVWGAAVPVDPGKHLISVSAPGYETWESTVEASGEGKTVAANVPPLVKKSEPPVVASAPQQPAPAQTAPADASTPSNGSTQRTIGLVVGGLGLVGIGVGAVFGLRAKSKLDDSNADGHCAPDNTCDGPGTQLRQESKDAATLSTIAFAAGGAALVGGAILFFTAPHGAKKAGLDVMPRVGHGGAGVDVALRF